jgi:hypothetical protein
MKSADDPKAPFLGLMKNHRKLQKCLFVGPVFELEVDFWSILVGF